MLNLSSTFEGDPEDLIVECEEDAVAIKNSVDRTTIMAILRTDSSHLVIEARQRADILLAVHAPRKHIRERKTAQHKQQSEKQREQ